MSDHQLSGSVTVTISTDRFVTAIATGVADQLMEWLTNARPMDDQTEPTGYALGELGRRLVERYGDQAGWAPTRDPHPDDTPTGEIPIQRPDPDDGYRLGRAAQCPPSCAEGHTYTGLCQAGFSADEPYTDTRSTYDQLAEDEACDADRRANDPLNEDYR